MNDHDRFEREVMREAWEREQNRLQDADDRRYEKWMDEVNQKIDQLTKDENVGQEQKQ